jgi:TetR/AcrR family transcriptional regulator
MAALSNSTEEHIKDIAKKVFFSEGRLNATTQEIANAAGVNRTLLNYYFRSREALFELVFHETMENFRIQVDAIIVLDSPLKKRLEKLIDLLLEEMSKYPYREIFFITQINQNSKEEKIGPPPEGENHWACFLKDIQSEIEIGNIPKMNPMDYVINIYALCIYPFLMKPVYTHMFQTSTDDYEALLKNRKEIAMRYLSLKEM